MLERYADPRALLRAGRTRVTAVIGRPDRFPTAAHFKSYLGLTPPRVGDRQHRPQRPTHVQSRIEAGPLSYQQMVERGAEHLNALCIVAGRLAERLWTVMHRGMPYVICDTKGRPVTPDQAKTIIAEQRTVTEDVRRRRRSKARAGKAPQQAHTGHDRSRAQGADKRGNLPHQRSSDRKPARSSRP
ncbi:hypothetical protein [Dactylosporangium sp. NPDC050588]|uniref:hypothetical protein n=1 Tax=Dactylosporangium sp. NPDC050588 TaxID=3157211 RepID=UPI0033C6BDAF